MTRSRRKLDRGLRQPSIYSRTEKQEKPKSHFWNYFLFLLIIAGIAYLVIFSPFFKIKSLTVGETQYLDRDKINKVISDYRGSLPFGINNNYLFFTSSIMEKKIGDVDGVKSVKVTKSFPSGVKIEIAEKVPVFVWQTLQKKYLVDEKGFVSQEFVDKFKDLPVVNDTKNVPVAVGAQIVDPLFATFIRGLNADFNTFTSSRIDKIEVPEITSEIKVTSTDKWFVLFDTTGTAKNQLINLSRVLQESKAKNKRLEYADLRIGDRIFYK